MIDWMIEVCGSFKCAERTWFLSVELFDRYLSKNRNIVSFTNKDVHPIGIISMYLASKYEDIYPINSIVTSAKISHSALS